MRSTFCGGLRTLDRDGVFESRGRLCWWCLGLFGGTDWALLCTRGDLWGVVWFVILRDGDGEEEAEFKSRVDSRDMRAWGGAGVEVFGLAGITQDLLLEAAAFFMISWFC